MCKLWIYVALVWVVQLSANAQVNFAPLGAKWTYNAQKIVPPNTWGPYTMEVIDVVEFNGKICSQIYLPDHHAGPWNSDTMYVYEQHDSVFYFSNYTDSFHLLYDFTAVAGDTIVIGGLIDFIDGECTSETSIVIDSIREIYLDNDTLTAWYYRGISFPCHDWYPFVIYERIGSLDFIVPTYGFHHRGVGGVRCYSDATGNYQIVNYPCDTVYTGTLNTADLVEQWNLFSSPNPVSSIMAFESDTKCYDCSILIHDMIGKLLFVGPQLIPGELDLQWLAPGMYMYQFSRQGSYSKSKLFLKTN